MIIVTETMPCLVGTHSIKRISLQDAVDLVGRTVCESNFKTVYKKDLYSRILKKSFTKTECRSHGDMRYLFIKDCKYISRESLELDDTEFPFNRAMIYLIDFKRF